MHREKTATLWFDVKIKDKQNERESVWVFLSVLCAEQRSVAKKWINAIVPESQLSAPS